MPIWSEEDQRDLEERRRWAYVNIAETNVLECTNCHRFQVYHCANGKTRCDKCNWVKEDNDYCPISLYA